MIAVPGWVWEANWRGLHCLKILSVIAVLALSGTVRKWYSCLVFFVATPSDNFLDTLLTHLQ